MTFLFIQAAPSETETQFSFRTSSAPFRTLLPLVARAPKEKSISVSQCNRNEAHSTILINMTSSLASSRLYAWVYIPFAVQYISAGLNTDATVDLSIRHHHVRFARIITVGIWDPDVFDLSSFYGKGAVELPNKTRIYPFLAEVDVCFIFLFTKQKRISTSLEAASTPSVAAWSCSVHLSGIGRLRAVLQFSQGQSIVIFALARVLSHSTIPEKYE